MNKEVSMYLDAVCAHIKSKQAQLSTRSELSGHIHDLIDGYKQEGVNEDEAVKLSLARMGDPNDIGRQISSYNLPWLNILTSLLGLALFAVLIWNHSITTQIYGFDAATFIYVNLFTLAFILIGGISQFDWFSFFARGRTAALYAGGTGMISKILSAAYTLKDLSEVGAQLSICLTSLLYGLVLSAVFNGLATFFRPIDGSEIRKILKWEE